MRPNEKITGHYFALPRLLRKWRGGSAGRSENDWREGYAMGVVVYGISYFFVANIVLHHLHGWRLALALALLLFGQWIFWLIVVYLNSLITKAIWGCGLATNLSPSRVQNVLIGILTTAFAAQLIVAGQWISWLGLLWLAAVCANLGAALLLAIWYDERS
jgi:hypothetical protein